MNGWEEPFFTEQKDSKEKASRGGAPSSQTSGPAGNGSLSPPFQPLESQRSCRHGTCFGQQHNLVHSCSAGGAQHTPISCLHPTPSPPACFYVPAQIDCDTFISSSVPLQQEILCCEFMAGLYPSLSYLVGQSSCNTWSSQHSHAGNRSDGQQHSACSALFCYNRPL